MMYLFLIDVSLGSRLDNEGFGSPCYASDDEEDGGKEDLLSPQVSFSIITDVLFSAMSTYF